MTKLCHHSSEDDYCYNCGEPQGSMQDFVLHEMLLDEYPPQIKMQMTPDELRRAIKSEKG